MNRNALIKLLVRPGESDQRVCKKLSANKFIAVAEWNRLENHEREFLRAYAVGVAAQKSILVGRSAAVVLGLWTLPLDNAPVTLANPGKRPPSKSQWPDGIEYCWMQIPKMDRHGIKAEGTDDTLWTSTRTRTAVDIARMYGVRHGVVAMDSLFYGKAPWEQHQIRLELEQTIERLGGKKGIAHARQALEWSSTQSESPFESLLRVILREHGIVVQEQMWIGRYARPDFMWGQLAIEIDGDRKLDGNPKAVSLEQTERENWIRRQNYETERIRPGRLLNDEAGVIRRILEAKARSEVLGPPKVKATRNRPRYGEDWRLWKAG